MSEYAARMRLLRAAAFVASPGLNFTMAHELSVALQQAGRIRERCALEESHVHMRSEYIHVAEGRISETCHRTAVMQEFPDLVPAFSHHLKPLMRDGSQFTCVLFHPRINGGIPLYSAVESQQVRSHRHGVFRAALLFHGATLSSYSMGSPKPSVWIPSWRRASRAISRRCALNVMIWAKTSPKVKVSAGSQRASTNVSAHAERFRTSLKTRCSSASVFSSLCSMDCGERFDFGGPFMSISTPDSAAVQTSFVKMMFSNSCLRVLFDSRQGSSSTTLGSGRSSCSSVRVPAYSNKRRVCQESFPAKRSNKSMSFPPVVDVVGAKK